MAARNGSIRCAVVALAVAGALLGACTPPSECATMLEIRDQDQRTVDGLAQYGEVVDAKQSADSARAFRDAAGKLKSNAARADALAPSDHALAHSAKSYVSSSKQIAATLDGLGARYETISAAQARFAAATDRVQAARAKMTTACNATPKPAGCADIASTLSQLPVDEKIRLQIIRDLETEKLDPALTPMRTEFIAALRETDVARKDLDAIGISAKASFSTVALTQAGGDIEKHCGRK